MNSYTENAINQSEIMEELKGYIKTEMLEFKKELAQVKRRKHKKNNRHLSKTDKILIKNKYKLNEYFFDIDNGIDSLDIEVTRLILDLKENYNLTPNTKNLLLTLIDTITDFYVIRNRHNEEYQRELKKQGVKYKDDTRLYYNCNLDTMVQQCDTVEF